MGLLSLGTPLHWDEAKQHADHVRRNGISQFLSIYHKAKDRENDSLLWGEEVEYVVVSFNDEHHRARISVRVFEMLEVLQKAELEADTPEKQAQLQCLWRPEYGRFMLEATPGNPYGSKITDLLKVEPNMRLRRRLAIEQCKPNEVPMTITNFPLLGTPDSVDGHNTPDDPASKSLFLPDQVINPHARFPTLTANIRRRRGSKVAINMPIFHDTHTPRPFVDPTIPRTNLRFPEYDASDAQVDHIYMDAMGFGMGCCCLQITFQACNVDEARRLYDHLAPVSSIMLALTAATPLFRGYLANVDCRWKVISQAVDDRTDEERGLKPLQENRFRINKSRYDSIDSYLGSSDGLFKPQYNDLDLVYDPAIYQRLVEGGIDDLLAKHLAHLFIRDPLVIFKELLNVDNESSSDHFEVSLGPCWRVEFRTMEIQFTDFENAAFTVFIVLLTRALLSYDLNFYIPITKMDTNIDVAHRPRAVLDEKFYFRKNIYTDKCDIAGLPEPAEPLTAESVDDEYELMTIDEIINGQEGGFVGLIPVINSYLDSLNINVETHCRINQYLNLVSKRANGELMTNATWIRQFVRNHPSYKQDSVISPEINYDLLTTIRRITAGELQPPELFASC
ncbi:glutamate--cysteine ligase [Dimargaris cristalligena]|nr:glutamate--cysteine ligase [Dimargaris cristalligena]